MYHFGLSAFCAILLALPAGAEAPIRYNLYGSPGLIEMPVAHQAPDGELAFSFSYLGESYRNTLSFQITPRLFGAFRYTKIEDWDNSADARFGGALFDRSFDLRFQILHEGDYTPAVKS